MAIELILQYLTPMVCLTVGLQQHGSLSRYVIPGKGIENAKCYFDTIASLTHSGPNE